MAKQIRPLSVAIAAMGGQGGGVLANWIIDVAENTDYLVQSTSVPGLAQRTGATVYYLEMFPNAEVKKAGRDPVMSLMPAPGDVDVVVAGELMEAGRAILRGIVTPDRTTLISSSHRTYALSEKMSMGDGRADSATVLNSALEASKMFVHFDMEELSETQGAVISAVMLGALAASEALPFSRDDFEAAIRRGVAVESNLAGFSAGYEHGKAAMADAEEKAPAETARLQAPHAQVNAMLTRIYEEFPEPAHTNLIEGVRRLIDYQDVRYAGEYLNRLEKICQLDRHNDGEKHDYELTTETARYLALWMSYEDTIRVADLKTRSKRFERFRNEVRAKPDQLVYVFEFMHPRVEEVCDTLPGWLGGFIMRSARLKKFLGFFCQHAHKIPTGKLSGFLLLYSLAALKRWRRMTYRYQVEMRRIERWLATIAEVGSDYELSVEVAECQRLVKGYGDTHARGTENFERIMSALPQIRSGSDPAQRVKELRTAALADEDGEILAAAFKKVA